MAMGCPVGSVDEEDRSERCLRVGNSVREREREVCVRAYKTRTNVQKCAKREPNPGNERNVEWMIQMRG